MRAFEALLLVDVALDFVGLDGPTAFVVPVDDLAGDLAAVTEEEIGGLDLLPPVVCAVVWAVVDDVLEPVIVLLALLVLDDVDVTVDLAAALVTVLVLLRDLTSPFGTDFFSTELLLVMPLADDGAGLDFVRAVLPLGRVAPPPAVVFVVDVAVVDVLLLLVDKLLFVAFDFALLEEEI